MEFWGVEVKSGEPLKVQPGDGMIIHLSQANVGEVKKEKASESVCLFINVDGKKLVLGTLLHGKLPQQQFDLVFDREFDLSHNSKTGSIYFYGYRASVEGLGLDRKRDLDSDSDSEADGISESEYTSDSSDSSDEEMEIPENIPEAEKKLWSNMLGKPVAVAAAAAAKANAGKDSAPGKQKVKIVEPPESDDDSEDEDDSDEDAESESEDEETPTPKKVQTGKKRAAESSASKTPVPDKKAKVSSTPQKTDGKKGSSHVATPHPSKQAGKTPANKSSSPKSGGSHSCGSCKKTFNSESAMQSHSKAKHSGGK